MDALNLIQEARTAGLVLRVYDGALNVSGPKAAAPIVQRLKTRKADILAALADEKTEPECDTVCMTCGGLADVSDSNLVHDNPVDTAYRRVHFAPDCYDAWFQGAFGKAPTSAQISAVIAGLQS